MRVFVCVVQAMPMEKCRVCAHLLGWFCADVIGLRQNITLENLRHAFPENSDRKNRRLSRRMWQHLFLMVVEVAHTPRKIHRTNWRKFVKLRGYERLVQELLSDRPVIIASGHFGNFELGGYMLGLLGFPTYTVARVLDNPHLDAFVNRFRSKTGQHIIPKIGGYDQIVRVLDDNGTMVFLADQYAGNVGVQVEFFGRPVSAFKAIALFALQHDAVMSVGSVRRMGKPLRYEMECTALADPAAEDTPLSDPKAGTQWYTSELERCVRKAPEQYWWLHTRWRLPPRWGKRRRAKKKKKQVA